MNIIIVAGGSFSDELFMSIYKELDTPFIIAADRGMKRLLDIGIVPDISTGDFDSMTDEEFEDSIKYAAEICQNKKMEVVRLIPEKADTDTEHALRLAIEKKPESITMLGVTGTRLDQTFASIEMLRLAYDAGVSEAYVVDEHNRIRVARGQLCLTRDGLYGKYISILPYSERLTDLTMKGFKYEIENFTLEKGISRCVSNEIADGVSKCCISCSGYYILMEIRE